jgi:long-chain acyl-CoA synthetase
MAFSVAGTIREQAKQRGDQPALTYGGRTTTFAELDRTASRVANGLAAEGVGPQDRVAFIDKNSPEWFELLFGGAKINAVNVSVNWRLAPREMAQIVNDAHAKVLVVGGEFLPHLDEVEDQLQTVTKVLVLGAHPKHESYSSWVEAQDDTDPGVEAGPEDVAMQLYTSGTTGLPKGAMITNANFATLLPATTKEWRFSDKSVNLVTMPLYHIGGGGWALVGFYNGCHSILMREVDPAAILNAIPQYGITHGFLVPAVIQMLLLTPGIDEADLSSLQLILYGASPIARETLVQGIRKLQCGFAQAYGLTETTGAITILRPEDHDPDGPNADRLRSCGVAFPWCETRVVDPETGDDRPVGDVGEIWSRSAQTMKGYWNRPEDTAKAITSDGWFKTGDAGYFDGDGYLYIHDRVKDMIVSGGENVYPAEVENVLFEHPAVADAAAIGVPHEKWGETVKAVVVLKPGQSATEQEIIDFARSRIAKFKAPTSVDFIELLPRNPSGKVLKRELREPYWAGHDRRVGG